MPYNEHDFLVLCNVNFLLNITRNAIYKLRDNLVTILFGGNYNGKFKKVAREGWYKSASVSK